MTHTSSPAAVDERFGIVVYRDVFVTMRDGIRLATDLFRPARDGEPLPGLPPSVVGVIDAERAGGGSTSLRSTTRGEWSIAVPYAVTGSRQLSLTIDPS